LPLEPRLGTRDASTLGMRTLILTVAVATSLAGCAGMNRASGASGGSVVSGENRSNRAESGSDTDSIATSGSNASDPTGLPSPTP
ncbi:MAG: hypothetical protein LC659_12520, partial [Myxococcales bacterium]|nr:hypothetical protein [Myxococcales bacterium]